MNDDLEIVEQELAHLSPARLTARQRARLRSGIAGQLSQPIHSFHWRPWLAWCGAAAAVVVIGLVLNDWSTNFKSVAREEVVLSNVVDAEVIRLIENPVCSNVRINQSFDSISFSNLPQTMLPARLGHKI